jgi:hypothetical protein
MAASAQGNAGGDDHSRKSVTLQVPDDIARDFRAAIVEEIAADAEFIRQEREGLGDAIRYRDDSIDIKIADLQSSTRNLERDVALATQVDLNGDGRFELRGDPSDLAHMCERLIGVLRPKLRRALDIGPMDAEQAADVHELTGRLTWAVDRAAELHADWAAGREV